MDSKEEQKYIFDDVSQYLYTSLKYVKMIGCYISAYVRDICAESDERMLELKSCVIDVKIVFVDRWMAPKGQDRKKVSIATDFHLIQFSVFYIGFGTHASYLVRK